MLKIGITGGIGSGKSTVCRLFALLGIPIYNADQEARKLMTSDAELVQALKKHFGPGIYTRKGELDRPRLASLVFNDAAELAVLNKLVHPAVLRHHKQWHQEQHHCPYTLKEAALLFESGSYKKLDAVILVSAPREMRIERTMQRDHCSREEVMKRMKQQWSESEKSRRSDYLLVNDENRSLIEQVADLHQVLLEKADKPKH